MQNLIVIALGVIVGLSLGESANALWGALLGWVLLRMQRQARELDALRKALRTQQDSLSELLNWREAAPPTSAASMAGAKATPRTLANAQSGASDGAETVDSDQAQSKDGDKVPAPPSWPEAAVSAARTPTFELPPRSPDAPAAQPQFAGFAALRARMLGGNTIVKSGVGILFLGLAFLAKYASEHVQLPVELRLAAVGAVALVLLALGWRLRHKRPDYAQALQGGAVAVLYLTLFVAFRYYAVLAVGPVFLLMALVAALSAALAVLQDSRALAMLGALGGFAAPLLVSTGSGDIAVLFGYYLVLDLGIAAIAWVRIWRLLNLIGFAATFLVGAAWGVLKSQPADYATGQIFLICFFLVFIMVLLLPARAAAASGVDAAALRTDAWLQGSLLFGLPTVTFVLQHGLVRDMEYGTALSALALAGFYIGLALWARRDAKHGALFEPVLAIATVFLTLVIPFAFDARSTGGAWAMEGAALVWLGKHQARRSARLFGYALLVLAGLALIHAGERYGAPKGWIDTVLINSLLLVAAALAAAFFVQRPRSGGQPPVMGDKLDEAVAEPLLIGWAMLWAAGAAARQIDALVAVPYQLAAGLVAASLMAGLCTLLAWRLDWKLVAWPALAHAPWLAYTLLASGAAQASPLEAGGGWAWPLALAAHLWVLRQARATPAEPCSTCEAQRCAWRWAGWPRCEPTGTSDPDARTPRKRGVLFNPSAASRYNALQGIVGMVSD